MATFEDRRHRVDRLTESDLSDDGRLDYDTLKTYMYKRRLCGHCGRYFSLFHDVNTVCHTTGIFTEEDVIHHGHFDYASEEFNTHQSLCVSRDHYLCLQAAGWSVTPSVRVREEDESVHIDRRWKFENPQELVDIVVVPDT
jgi:hypothetical protein